MIEGGQSESDDASQLVPHGGFTDVGLHTGTHPRDTAWPLVRETLKVCAWGLWVCVRTSVCAHTNPHDTAWTLVRIILRVGCVTVYVLVCVCTRVCECDTHECTVCYTHTNTCDTTPRCTRDPEGV